MLAMRAVDPDNRLLWTVPYRRLEVEVIRDAMLAASGELNRQMYGPSMYPAIPGGGPCRQQRPRQDLAAVRRASRFEAHDLRFREAFADRADARGPRLLRHGPIGGPPRNITSVPTQALTLLNGDFVNLQARHLADRLEREAGPDPVAQIERAYQLSLCRAPRDGERSALRGFLDRESRGRLAEAARAGSPITMAEAHHQALVQLCRALFNTNEFVYPD